MIFRAALALCAALTLVGCNGQPVNRKSDMPLASVENVEIDRYLGRWYEIARLPNRFEKNCEGVTADYTLRDDGLISVTNTCRKDSASGKAKVAKGRARVVDETTNAKLEVSFFGPFWGDYWIIDLAEDYSLSIVGEPSGRYLWVLSRTPIISEGIKDDMLNRLIGFGYDVGELYYPQQSPMPNNPRG